MFSIHRSYAWSRMVGAVCAQSGLHFPGGSFTLRTWEEVEDLTPFSESLWLSFPFLKIHHALQGLAEHPDLLTWIFLCLSFFLPLSLLLSSFLYLLPSSSFLPSFFLLPSSFPSISFLPSSLPPSSILPSCSLERNI